MEVQHAPAISLNSSKICWDGAKKTAIARSCSKQVVKNTSTGLMEKDCNRNKIYYSCRITKCRDGAFGTANGYSCKSQNNGALEIWKIKYNPKWEYAFSDYQSPKLNLC